MDRIRFVADPHAANHKICAGVAVDGINDRCARVLDCLEQAAKAGPPGSTLVVLGDLFDVDKPSPTILAETGRALRSGRNDVIALVGNHDQTSAPTADLDGEHALAPLRSSKLTVVDRPTLIPLEFADLIAVPFSPAVTPATLPGIIEGLLGGTRATNAPRVRVLCLHLGVWDKSTPPWLVGAHDAIAETDLRDIARTYRIAFVECGNWHNQRAWSPRNGDGVHISQVGALAPTGWDNPGLVGYGGVDMIEVLGTMDRGAWSNTWIHGPRFLAFGRPGEPAAESFEKVLAAISKPVKCYDEVLRRHALYVRLYVASKDIADGARRVREAVAGGLVVAGEALALDTAENRAATSAAAVKALASGLNHDEAIARYVQAREYPPGVTAAAVLGKVRGYLGGAP